MKKRNYELAGVWRRCAVSQPVLGSILSWSLQCFAPVTMPGMSVLTWGNILFAKMASVCVCNTCVYAGGCYLMYCCIDTKIKQSSRHIYYTALIIGPTVRYE